MHGFANETHRDAWAVILAGGDGTRLQKLTFKIAGDSRPKQFCRVFGNKSLLGQTQNRIDPEWLQEMRQETPLADYGQVDISNSSTVVKFREFANGQRGNS